MRLVRPLSMLALIALSACFSEGGIADYDPWTIPEPVEEPPDYGTWLSMDVAPDGERIVIAYYDRSRGNLGFAVGRPQADGTVDFVHERADDGNAGGFTNTVGEYASMKVAPDGTVWIAYYDATAKQLKWAHRTAGGPATQSKLSWQRGVIDAGPNVGTWASLDIDANGGPVVAYHDEALGVLKVARPVDPDADAESMTWTTAVAWQGTPYAGTDAEGQPVTRPADVGEHARLLIEGGTEFIAYYDRAQQRLGLLEGVNGTYTATFVSPEGVHAGQWPSMLRDGGTLYIAYHDVGNQQLMVSSRTPAGWVHEVGDSAAFTGADTEIVKRGGAIGVLYFDGQNNDMKYSSKQGTVWLAETIGGNPTPEAASAPVGFHNEIVRVGESWWAASYDFSTKSLYIKELPTGVQ